MKKIATVFLMVLSSLLSSQIKYDSIAFDNITLNGLSLFTKFHNIKKFINDKETNAKVYTGKDIEIPFKIFREDDILYTVFSKNIIFNYEESKPEDIFITYLKPNRYLKVKIKTTNGDFLLNSKITNSFLKKNFKNSYLTSIKNKKDFRLVVKCHNQYAFLDIVINKKGIPEMFLLTE